ncbi:MAG: ABC transporter ATP-binding protein, partial [Parasporobacterium sp.]|nr:ABC transporter ATP-binding protein [Parasporobacterium sp.]
MGKTVIELKNVSKDYYIYSSNMRRALGVLFGLKPKTTKHALNDISFTVEEGERVAIMGKLGAGRTTLLKIISGVAYATKGKVIVNGSVNCFLKRKAGFDNKLTCRENVRLKATSI